MNILNSIFSTAFEAKEAAFEAKEAAFEAKEAAFEAKEADFKAKEAAFEAKEAAFEAKEADFKAKEADFKAKEAAFKQQKKEMLKQFELDKIDLYKQLDYEHNQLFNMIKNPIRKKQKEIEEKNLSIKALENMRNIKINKKTLDEFDRDDIDQINDNIDDLYRDIKACEIASKYGKELWSSIKDLYQLKSNI
jgi:uncharacterized glyoxalase superfamily metalloenzyme YdcJ